MRGRASDERKRERGTVMVLVALAATALLLFAALTVDVGLIWSTRTQGQNVSDLAALAAASTMIDPSGPSVTLQTSRDEAKKFAKKNRTVDNASVKLHDEHIVYGNWNLATRTFDSSVNLSDPNQVTAVQVTVVQDDAVNKDSPAFLSVLLGQTGFEVQNVATAYLGFEGSAAAGEYDLPIAIWSCRLVTNPTGCGDDFCSTVETPDNPCTLDPKQDHDVDDNVTCLEFSSQPEQNACWTDFGTDNSVNSPGLENVVDDGNPHDNQVGDRVRMDNGEKESTQMHIEDVMQERGVDRYPPFDGTADSWVVKLPVVDCGEVGNCDRTLARLVGGVCFEVREVTGPPSGKIKGRFLCPNDSDPEVRDLIKDHCDGSGSGAPGNAPGGCNFGLRAEKVVLVD